MSFPTRSIPLACLGVRNWIKTPTMETTHATTTAPRRLSRSREQTKTPTRRKKHSPQPIRDPTQRKATKHSPDGANAVECALPTRRKDRLAIRDVSKVRAELGDTQQAPADLVVRTSSHPASRGQRQTYAERRTCASYPHKSAPMHMNIHQRKARQKVRMA